MTAEAPLCIHWFRRDLRLEDNHGLYLALRDHGNVLPLFIFDTHILERLPTDDRRVDHIHRTLSGLKQRMEAEGGSLLTEHGDPLKVWERILERYPVKAVTFAHDHESYAKERDGKVERLLRSKGITVVSCKDISIFERSEVMKDDGGPYTVFTPYARKWRALFSPAMAESFPSERKLERFYRCAPLPFPSLESLGFERTDVEVPPLALSDALLKEYAKTRDRPDVEGTSRMSVHLRFGTVSARELVRRALKQSDVFLNELIWREFFMQILWHFPHAEKGAFRPEYEHIRWRNNEAGFQAWCEGRTGYPLVDAGMRELAATGLMHNRVRMVTASFLCKHLLTDWRWGEAWFGQKLLDFELSSNNGNWQWACGSGCDAAPWFRVFNPTLQQEKFDPQLRYVKRWVPEFGGTNYVAPIVVHKEARQEAIAQYTAGLAEGRRER